MLKLNKSIFILILGILYFSISAFSAQFHQIPSSPDRPIMHFRDSINKTPVSSIFDYSQSTVIYKAQKTLQPTKTPKPTSTPPVIPPPADPSATSVMIILAVFMVMVILFGFWLNRRRVF